MNPHRKFTLEEINSWPEIHPDHELKVLQLLLDNLENEEDYETCIVVYNRMNTLKAKCKPSNDGAPT